MLLKYDKLDEGWYEVVHESVESHNFNNVPYAMTRLNRFLDREEDIRLESEEAT